MRYLTAIAAAKRIGVAEKTVRLWIKEGKLEALHPAKNRLAIAEADVERIAQERQLYYGPRPEVPSNDRTQPDVSALEARIRELENRVAALEAASSQPPVQTVPTPVVPTIKPPQTKPQKRTTARKSDLPEGCILASKFAEQLGIPRRTFADYMLLGFGSGLIGMSTDTIPQKEMIEYSDRPKPGREHTGERERYLTPEQQAQAIALLKKHGKLS